ncbi:MAG: hypothetical protein ACD_3C00061G0003 [uncultured bacterium (gcode 4)]|uniref:Bacterial type II secretion system protein E domain-containing protein n=1 Tax=uncultured bacterium (gcode 4) TaxID=1234023 RepID=K2GDQ3_9BACT|nr:MAG: hypothetical protein ACD_3C00061G0003 [uncultured bacterium (gcode 4)]
MQIKDFLKISKAEETTGSQAASEIFAEQKSTQNDGFDINWLFSSAIKEWASDIHIEPDEDWLKLRFRVDWKLSTYKTFPPSQAAPLIARLKVLWSLKIDEKRLPQDWKANYKDAVTGYDIDLRINIIPTIYWEKAAIRLLKKENEWVDLRTIWILPMNMVKIKKHLQDNFWLCLVVWPTWSGKSTTLYAMLNVFDTNDKNISTLEDPVEYRIKWVNHTQINPQIWFNFADWLRSLLRQDPDIIMVWEIRDPETAKLAVEASITWHQVFSTLHANSSVNSIQRLVNLWVDPLLITSSLKLIISQRLARKLCSHCKVAYKPEDNIKDKVLKRISRFISDPNDLIFYKSSEAGCEKCNGKWYKWRTWVYEILEMTEWLEKLILSWASKTQMEVQAIGDWMITIKDDALIKVVLWEISLEEVFSVLWS